ncbi:MAG: hypothetical protein AB4352_14780 [Hormoscilla sp.]
MPIWRPAPWSEHRRAIGTRCPIANKISSVEIPSDRAGARQ